MSRRGATNPAQGPCTYCQHLALLGPRDRGIPVEREDETDVYSYLLAALTLLSPAASEQALRRSPGA